MCIKFVYSYMLTSVVNKTTRLFVSSFPCGLSKCDGNTYEDVGSSQYLMEIFVKMWAQSAFDFDGNNGQMDYDGYLFSINIK